MLCRYLVLSARELYVSHNGIKYTYIVAIKTGHKNTSCENLCSPIISNQLVQLSALVSFCSG